MALQKVFSQSYTQQLRNSISIENYLTDTFAYDTTQVKTLMSISHPENLAEYMVEHSDNDFECAVALYEAYSKISPVFAQEERLWTYLSHVDLFHYIKKRWPIPEDKSKQLSHINAHWFKNAAIIRSSLMGLWWAVYCTIDGEREDKYEFTRVLFSNYSFRTMFYGATKLFWYSEATKGILHFLADNPEITKQHFENRSLYITKYFNQLGGIKNISSLDKDYFYNECSRIKNRIMSIKFREDVQNKNAF